MKKNQKSGKANSQIDRAIDSDVQDVVTRQVLSGIILTGLIGPFRPACNCISRFDDWHDDDSVRDENKLILQRLPAKTVSQRQESAEWQTQTTGIVSTGNKQLVNEVSVTIPLMQHRLEPSVCLIFRRRRHPRLRPSPAIHPYFRVY